MSLAETKLSSKGLKLAAKFLTLQNLGMIGNFEGTRGANEAELQQLQSSFCSEVGEDMFDAEHEHWQEEIKRNDFFMSIIERDAAWILTA